MSDEPVQPSHQPKLPGDVLAIVLRRRWALLGPFFCCGFLGFGVARLVPPSYRSEAMILLEQQKIPDRYVTPNVITNLQQRLDNVTQQILSRTQLQRLIEQVGAHPRERTRAVTDDLVDRMRKAITIELVQTPGRQGELTGFRISYSASDPRSAQGITNALTSLFIEENVRSRSQQSEGTTAFLGNQLQDAQRELDDQEIKLRDYKTRYLGELPEQQQANLQVLGSLEAQIFANTAALERATQQKVYLEAVRAQYAVLQKSPRGPGQATPVSDPGQVSRLTSAQATLHDLQVQLAAEQSVLMPNHPSVIRIRSQISEWQKTVLELEAEAYRTRETPQAVIAAKSDPNPVEASLIEMDSKLKATEVEITSLTKDAAELRKRIQEYQGRVNMAPLRQQQSAEVTRDYENAQANFQSLLQKKMESELASNLEKRQMGEQFRVLDSATLPRRAEGRLKITFLGWVLGGAAGVMLMFLRETADDVLRTRSAVCEVTDIPILLRVPVFRTRRENIGRVVRRALESVAVLLLCAGFVGTAAHIYFEG